jgi:hypothetical protein
MKVWLVCLAHNNPSIVMEAVRKYKEQNKEMNFDHEWIMVDCDYPLPHSGQNHVDIASIAAAYDMTLLKPYKNRGVSGNWNWVVNEVGAKDEDIMIGIDPDGRVRESGWVSAIVEVFKHEPRAYYVACNQISHGGWTNVTTTRHETTSGVGYLEFPHIVAWSLGGFKVGHIRKIGGLHERRPFYGFIEDETHKRMQSQGDYTFFKLENYFDFHLTRVDPLYMDWKKAMVEGLTKLSLSDWIKEEGLKC